MTFLVICPDVEIITLTRDMNLTRQFEIDYLNKNGFKADFKKLKYSYNTGIWGTSICGGEILDPAQGLPETAYLKQVEKTGSELLKIEFKKGEIIAVNGKKYTDKIKDSSQPLFYIVQFSTNYSLFKYALYKKVTICALLQISSGEKVLSVVPLVIPLPNAHVTAL